jgi:hypothetical protein
MFQKLHLPLALSILLFSCNTEKKITQEENNRQTMHFLTLHHSFKIWKQINYDFQVTIEKTKDTAKIRRMEKLTEATNFYIKQVGFRRQFLFDNIGGRNLDSNFTALKRPAEFKRVEEYLIGKNKKGEAYLMEPFIDAYIDFLNKEYPSASKIPFESPVRLKGEKNHDFPITFFKGASAVEALNTLVSIQIELLIRENTALNQILYSEVKTKEKDPYAF